MHSPTISTATIVRNEKRHIKALIHNVIDFVDEMIVVDTGSTDGTLEELRSFEKQYAHLKVFEYIPSGVFHFGKAKNVSLHYATSEYIIILDADERLSDEFKSDIRDFLLKHPSDVVSVKRVDRVLPHFIEYIERIVRKSSNIFYREDEEGRVHESLVHSHPSHIFDEIVWHDKGEDHHVFHPEKGHFQLELQVARTPKQKSFAGHVLRGMWYFWFRFRKLYFKRGLYKDGWLGFKYSIIRSIDAFQVEYLVGKKPR